MFQQQEPTPLNLIICSKGDRHLARSPTYIFLPEFQQ
jgi:hypothetical protein